MLRVFFCVFIIFGTTYAWASKPSYYLAHPVGWMHMLPVGETPGWGKSMWFNLESNQANIWNDEFNLTNRTTGETLTYHADFEQGSVIADLGFAVSDRIAFGLVAPFASRGGGVMDDFIDQFHQFIGSERFMRPYNESFSNRFEVETGGNSQLRPSLTAVGNLKFKMKYWMWQVKGSANGSCDCGLAVSGQVKFPVAKPNSGWSSGHHDYSLLVHLGFPMFRNSGVWATAGFTALGRNDVFENWPQRRWAQMYELSIDLGFTERWGLLLQARAESPIMNKNELSYNYTTSDPDAQIAYRVASGWNSLVHWRGSQSAGLRFRSSGGHQVNLLIIEDWGLGSQDSRKDSLYVNNAPDVAFALQLHTRF